MNFLGHTHAALASDDDPAFLVGAVLPDLAPMARVRVDRSRLTGLLARGVRAHLQTDAAFHAHPEFRRGVTAIRDDLVDHQVRRGPARAVAHAGWELLLDGTLIGSATEAAFHGALDHAGDDAAVALASADQAQWHAFLARWRELPSPRLRYDDPAWVADRLHDMLATRPRLSFPRSQVPVVRQVLATHAPAVVASASTIFASVRDATTPV
ncbi:MAG: hypothetical protein ACRD2C_17915 [Acidimicrobiales bacterium]